VESVSAGERTVTDAPSPAKPLAFRVLIDEAIGQVRRNFRAVYPAVAMPMALALVPLTFFYMRQMVSFTRIGEVTDPAEMVVTLMQFGLLLSGLMLVHGGAYVASMVAATDIVAGRPVEMGKSWLFMLRLRPAVTFLLVGLLVAAATLFCVLPGIYVGLLMSFIIPVMVDEHRFGMGAVKRSARLLNFNSRLSLAENPVVKLFLFIFVAWLLGAVLGMVIQLPFTVVQQIVLMRQVTEGEAPDPGALMESMSWLQIPSSAIGALVTAALYLYMSFGMALLYFDARHRREGDDLEAALESMSPATSKDDAP
jgi:uncharacterized membrane protein